MGRRIPNSMLRMPGVPEDEDIVGPPETAKIIPDDMVSEKEASLMETELPEEPESIAQREAALEAERFAASPQGRYSTALKAAAEAGPTAEDYRSAALRRSIGEMRAGMPSYLQQMSTTLFHKPDFSGQAAAARTRLERPEYEIRGKEAEQKRLQDVAEGMRKEIMLPAEMAEKRAKSLKTEAEIKNLEAKGAPLTDVRRKLYETQINRFITKNKLGEPMQLPEGITDADAGRLFMAAQRGDTTSWRDARLAFDQQKLEFQKGKEATAEGRRALEREEKELGLGLSLGDEVFKARTQKEAQELRNKVAATNTVYQGMDKIKKAYEGMSLQELSKTPKAIQEIGVRSKDLIMQIKEIYGLGAPQEGELKFLYDLVSSGKSTLDLGKDILARETLGTSLSDKLDALKDQFNTYVKSELATKAVKVGGKPAGPRVSPPPAKTSTPAAKPGRKVITDPNEL